MISPNQNIRFPDEGVYHGYFNQYYCWTHMDRITITFIDGELKGSGKDFVGEYEWSLNYKSLTSYSANKKIQVWDWRFNRKFWA